jgi:hypothetical protein
VRARVRVRVIKNVVKNVPVSQDCSSGAYPCLECDFQPFFRHLVPQCFYLHCYLILVIF